MPVPISAWAIGPQSPAWVSCRSCNSSPTDGPCRSFREVANMNAWIDLGIGILSWLGVLAFIGAMIAHAIG